MDKAKQHNPRFSYVYLWVEGRMLFLMGRYDEAAARLEAVVARNPAFDQGHILLAAIYGAMGRIDDAEWQAEEVLSRRPEFTISSHLKQWGYRVPEQRRLITEGLRAAGIPD